MRIIGIDPGIERTGFAVLEMNRLDGKIVLKDYGCIVTERRSPFSHRLACLASDLKIILRRWKPDAAGVEQVFFSKNVKTAMKVSHARGVILEVLEERGVPVQEFNPNHIKSSVTGDSKADKLQVKKMLQYTLGISIKNDDAADAIACGICLLTTQWFDAQKIAQEDLQ